MKIVKSLFFSLVLITACMFTSCSQDELFEPQTQVQNEDAMTRAITDLFDVEMLYSLDDEGNPETVSIGNDLLCGTDHAGNLYWMSVYNGMDYITKYNVETGTYAPFAPFGNYAYTALERICSDENNNLYYLIYDGATDKYGVRMVRADGQVAVEEWLNDLRPLSMDVALNGNMFFLTHSYPEGYEIHRLTPNGALTKLNIDLSAIGSVTTLYKASGAIIYLFGYNYDNTYYKLNTNTGVVETFQHRLTWNSPREIASSTTKGNVYRIDGRRIIQLRPNAATDLTIGTIPSMYRNADGQDVTLELAEDPELLINADATVFYTQTADCAGFYKLTLP